MIKILAFFVMSISVISQTVNWKYYDIGIKKYGYLIKKASYNTKLPESLIEAVICIETVTWNERAHNRNSDCIGLMGIQSNKTKHDIERLKNPILNIKFGSMILLHKIKKRGSLFKGLTEYGNAKWYAKKVLKFKKQIEERKKGVK